MKREELTKTFVLILYWKTLWSPWFIQTYFSAIRDKISLEIADGWPADNINPLTAGAAYIRVFIFYQHIKYHLLNMLKIKCDINQQYLKTVDYHFVKPE